MHDIAQPLYKIQIMYLWQNPNWPNFQYNAQALTTVLAQTRLAQQRMLALVKALEPLELATLQQSAWVQEAVATAQMDGETLPVISVQASATRRLGLPSSGTTLNARIEATLDLLQAVVHHPPRPMADEDLFAWHAALFPIGRSGLNRIATGAYRNQSERAPIVAPRWSESGERHYQAPASADVPAHMAQLLQWLSQAEPEDALVRAAIAHLWFEAVQPFEDGNGRMGRALAELLLAQDPLCQQRLFSLSAQFANDREGYDAQLRAATTQPMLDVTPWVQWFVSRVQAAYLATAGDIETTLAKKSYWAQVDVVHPGLLPTQRKVLARLLDAQPDGFKGGLRIANYVSLTHTSHSTAEQELEQLATLGLLEKTGEGRGTRYQLVV